MDTEEKQSKVTIEEPTVSKDDSSSHIRKKILLITLIIFVLSIAGFLLLKYTMKNDSLEYSGPVESIKVAAYEGDVSALIYLAQDKDFFTAQGLDVEIIGYQSGRQAMDALLLGQADVASAGSAAFVADSFTRPDIRIIGTLATLDLNQIIGRKDRGIDSAEDLVGKKIAILKNSTPEFLLERYLAYNDILAEDVELIYMSVPEIVDGVRTGSVDAGVIWDPLAFDLKNELEDSVFADSIQIDERDNFLIVSTEKWLSSNADAAERFTRAIFLAEEYANNNSEGVKNYIANKFQLDENYANDLFSKITLKNYLPQSLLINMEDVARWRISKDIASGELPNYLDYIYFNALDAVNPESVTIIR